MFKKNLFLLIFIIMTISIFSQTNIFWENENLIDKGNIGRFEVVNNDKILGIVYADVSKKFALNIKYSTDGNNFTNKFTGVNKFFSNTPIGTDFSTFLDKNNNLYICYRVSEKKFSIIKYSYPFEEGKYEKITDLETDIIIYLPKIYVDLNNDIHLLYSSNLTDSTETSFIINYKKISSSGEIISQQRLGKDYKSSLNPYIIENNGVLYICFQARIKEIAEGIFYNIVLAKSSNLGRNWNYDIVVESTGENNQSPVIFFKNSICHLSWEKEDKNFISHIYYKSFTVGAAAGAEDKIISSKSSEAYSPNIIWYNGILYIFWYDNEKGSFQNYYAPVDFPEERKILFKKAGRTLNNEIVNYKGNVKFFWSQSSGDNYLYFLKTDGSVNKPEIRISGNTASNYLNIKDVKFIWNRVDDISGISGYRVLLTKNKQEPIPENTELIYYTDTFKEYKELSDGDYYFKVKAYDRAGNNSDESVFAFSIDTTNPYPPDFIDPEIGSDGTLNNNSPLIRWKESNEPLESYRYYYRLVNMNRAGDIDKIKDSLINSNFRFTNDNKLQLENLENGILLVGIRGYDKAGNISEIRWREYKLNDYVAVTYISYVTSKILQSGDNVLHIYGRGFKMDGDVDEIYIDKNRKPPFDYIIPKSHFIVKDDKFVMQTKELDVDEGNYFIGVKHPVRGVTFSNIKSNFSGEWIFKYGEENYLTFDRIIFMNKRINIPNFLFIVFPILWLAIIFIIFSAIAGVIRDQLYLKRLIGDLDSAKEMLSDSEYFKRRKKMRKKGLGLTFKYTLLILLLVITIVVGTSFTLSFLALRNEIRNLSNEMKERALLVMENYYVTMTDIFSYEGGEELRLVDTTRNIAKIKDIGFVMYIPTGEEETPFLVEAEKMEAFMEGIEVEGLDKSSRDNTVLSVMIDRVFTKEAKEELDAILKEKEFKGEALIYPNFNPTNVNDIYYFVKPVFNNISKEYEAAIVIGYSFDRIIKLINEETWYLIRLAGLVTLIAVIISIFGAVFLAATTIRPIRKMSKHVNVISKTVDFEKLLGTDNEKIEVKSKDEIGILASSINDMTIKLIEKAKADKQMMLGKEIQKKFIPLEPHETEKINIFGFYEGAKGVSGDYFDYKKLDEDNYAFIICDVAGKAVPAALIMVQISTIFHSYFSNFDPKKNKIETVSIVNSINDTVAERGFTGRFAAILIVILNVKTGKALMTNAGYTQLLVYRDKLRKAEWITLNDAGAAGVFPSYMLPNPYSQEYLKVDKGDIIYLFTDGIEESRNGKMIKNEKGEESPEEFGLVRVKNIVDNSHGKTPKEVISTIIDEENVFRGDLEQYDDLTLLGIKLK